MTDRTKDKETTQPDRFEIARLALEELQANPILQLVAMSGESLRLLTLVMDELPKLEAEARARLVEYGTEGDRLKESNTRQRALLASLKEDVAEYRAALTQAARGEVLV